MQKNNMDLKKVKKETVNEYVQHLTQIGKSPATVTRSTASIKSFYNFMMQAGHVKTNPAKAVMTMSKILAFFLNLVFIAHSLNDYKSNQLIQKRQEQSVLN
jgi:site-specific recombinase XerD